MEPTTGGRSENPPRTVRERDRRRSGVLYGREPVVNCVLMFRRRVGGNL